MYPLQGLTVVTLEHAIAAPFATRQLADLGAESSRSSAPASATSRADTTCVRGLASHFVWTNRSKESLTLDVKHPAAAEVHRAAGARERRTWSFRTWLWCRGPPRSRLRGARGEEAAIIVCDISGYGANGPYRDKKAYDLLIQSEAGLVSVTDARCCGKAGLLMADIAAGMYAYTNILAALLQRGQTGRGQHIDISMLESLADGTSYPLYYAFGRRATAAAHRRGARDDLSLRPVPYWRRRRQRDARPAERARNGLNFCDKVLLCARSWRATRASAATPGAWPRAALRAIIVETFGPLTTPQVVGTGSRPPPRSPMRASTPTRRSASAVEGARTLARGRLAGRSPARRCWAPGTKARDTLCPPSASTPM